MTKSPTKFDKLVAVYAQIGRGLEQLDHPIFEKLTSVCLGTTNLREVMRNENPPLPPSRAVPGLEQGLRDLSLMLLNAPDEFRAKAVAYYLGAVQEHYPDFLERDRVKLKEIFDRGSVRTASEWYVLQHRLDEIEGDPKYQDEVERLWELMDGYAG